jgi:NADPH-dependent curcumin reductase CurA
MPSSEEQGMNDPVNRQLKLARRPEGRVSLDDFSVEESAPPPVEQGAVLARTLFLSVDPTNRVWMKDVPLIHASGCNRRGRCAFGRPPPRSSKSRLDALAPGDLVLTA